MENTPNDIEASLEVPEHLADAIDAHVSEQARERGTWDDPRVNEQPASPWPGADNPMLQFLLWKAQASLDAGLDVQTVMLQLGVHAWFEGGIENYDRGQTDARRLRPA